MRFLLLMAAMAMQLLFSLPAQAGSSRVNEFDQVFGRVPCTTHDMCIIKYNGGGYIDQFENAAKAVNRSKLRVAIVGQCYSACTLFADKARNHVCIGPNVEFGFHVAFRGSQVAWDDPLPGHSQDIYRWVEAHGGYPTHGLLMMHYADAHQFWKRCA